MKQDATFQHYVMNDAELSEIDGGANVLNVIGGTAGCVSIAWAPVAALALGPVAGVAFLAAGTGAMINLIKRK